MKDIKQKSVKQEKKLAKKLDGLARKGSGCGALNKGDVVSKGWLAECKYTGKQSIRLTKKMIEKIEQEAVEIGKEPLIELQIQDRIVYVLMDYQFDVIRDRLEA